MNIRKAYISSGEAHGFGFEVCDEGVEAGLADVIIAAAAELGADEGAVLDPADDGGTGRAAVAMKIAGEDAFGIAELDQAVGDRHAWNGRERQCLYLGNHRVGPHLLISQNKKNDQINQN